jgi:hypothetical protein
MPVFHFNSLTGDMFLPDPEGEELPSVAAAREAAEITARESLIEAGKTGDIAPDCIQVTDSEGHEVVNVLLKDLLRTDSGAFSPSVSLLDHHKSSRRPLKKG